MKKPNTSLGMKIANNKRKIADLELRIEKLYQHIGLIESKIPEFITGTTVSNVEFKIGDYVEVKELGKCKIIGCDGDRYDVYDEIGRYISIPKNHIIDYARPDLLTQEEKESLKYIFKGLRSNIKAILKNDYFIYVYNFEGIVIADFKIYDYYKNLKKDRTYTLEELGL